MKKPVLLALAGLLISCDPGVVVEATKTMNEASEAAHKELTAEPEKPEAPSEGVITQINPDTKVKNVISYKDGAKNGLSQAFYPSGKIWKENYYVDGELDSVAKIFNEDGSVKRESNYSRGYRHGTYTEFFKSGKAKFETEHSMGKPLIGYKDRNYKGELIPLPSISSSAQEIPQGEAMNIKVSFKIEGKGIKKSTPVEFYFLPEGVDWDATDMTDLIAYRLPKGEGDQEAQIELDLAAGRYISIDGQVVVVIERRSDLPVAVAKDMGFHFENP